jgi:hypothetical protein
MGKGDDEKVTLTRGELRELVAEQVRTALVMATAPKAMSEDEKFQAEIASRKGTDRPPLPTSVVKGVTSETGSTFDALIDHRGNVVALDKYAHPTGVDVHQTDGGLVPQGLPIRDAGGGDFSMLFKQWRYESFWAHDLNAYIGKPLPAHARRAA